MSSPMFERIQRAATAQPAWKPLVLVTVALSGLTVILYIQQNTQSSLGTHSEQLLAHISAKNPDISSVLEESSGPARAPDVDKKGVPS
ncbi:hypothetical protein R3P38DRAFT_3173247 [Favolaschia claudopus]|uniref:Uncharacterized protein n=1 Tax=Favolaschia claudopus TaxID=2862362 RepID=A0AAW0DII6_9AGAR